MNLALQLYTVRDLLAADTPGTLKSLGKIGFKYVELAGFGDYTAEDWGGFLADAGLTACSSHISIEAMNSDPEKTLGDLKRLGVHQASIAWVPDDLRGDWVSLTNWIDEKAKFTQAQGMHLNYHNHDFEFEKVEGMPKLDYTYSHVSADILGSQLDLAWVQVAGYSPVEYMQKYGARSYSVHLKDTKGGGSHVDTIAGTGVVNLKEAAAIAKSCNVQYGIVEMDNPPEDALQAVAKCLEYLSSVI